LHRLSSISPLAVLLHERTRARSPDSTTGRLRSAVPLKSTLFANLTLTIDNSSLTLLELKGASTRLLVGSNANVQGHKANLKVTRDILSIFRLLLDPVSLTYRVYLCSSFYFLPTINVPGVAVIIGYYDNCLGV